MNPQKIKPTFCPDCGKVHPLGPCEEPQKKCEHEWITIWADKELKITKIICKKCGANTRNINPIKEPPASARNMDKEIEELAELLAHMEGVGFFKAKTPKEIFKNMAWKLIKEGYSKLPSKKED